MLAVSRDFPPEQEVLENMAVCYEQDCKTWLQALKLSITS